MKVVPLTRERAAVVDDGDYQRVVAAGPWRFAPSGRLGYAAGCIAGRPVLMHRLILDAPEGSHIDHVNGNGLDNRRCNLRFATRQQNQANRPKTGCLSVYKGVQPIRHGVWEARCAKKSLGTFTTEIAAAAAYDVAARKQWGEFARLNLPRDGEQSALVLVGVA